MTDHNRCYCSTHTHGIEGGFGPLPPNDRYQHGDHCSHTTRHSFGCRRTIPGPMHAAVGTILRVSHRQSHSGSGVCNIFQRSEGYYSTGTTTVICFIHSPQVDVCLPHYIARKKHNPYKGSEPRTKTIHFLSSVDQVCRSFPVEINLQSPFIKDQPRMF